VELLQILLWFFPLLQNILFIWLWLITKYNLCAQKWISLKAKFKSYWEIFWCFSVSFIGYTVFSKSKRDKCYEAIWTWNQQSSFAHVVNRKFNAESIEGMQQTSWANSYFIFSVFSGVDKFLKFCKRLYLFSFVLLGFCTLHFECHEWSAEPVSACLRCRLRGCFRSERCTGGESMAAPCVNFLAHSPINDEAEAVFFAMARPGIESNPPVLVAQAVRC